MAKARFVFRSRGKVVELKKEQGPGRGWWGPPKGTHAGQGTEKVGLVTLPDSPDRKDYINARIFNDSVGNLQTDLPVVTKASQLGPIPEGMTRFYHGTNIRNVESILERGILTGREAQKKEQLTMILGTTDGASSFGNVSFACDLPSSKVRQVNSSWAEVASKISPDSFVGLVIGNIEVDSRDREAMIRLFGYYADWDKREKAANGTP